MSRNPDVDYTKYVHEYEDKNGVTRYAVAQKRGGQYVCPVDKRTAELTGCGQEFANTPAGLGGYLTRQKALRRARYIFAEPEY